MKSLPRASYSCIMFMHVSYLSLVKDLKVISLFFISWLNMKNCGNFFNLTRKAKPVLSSINCTINVETCNISVHCWHTRLSFFIFVKKTSYWSWELFEEKLGNLMCSPKDFLMNRIYWTKDCRRSCHKHAFLERFDFLCSFICC